MKNNISIDIASPRDRERLVAEIFVGADQWAEINQEGERLQLEMYPRQDGQPWVIDYDDAVQALADARRRLLGEA